MSRLASPKLSQASSLTVSSAKPPMPQSNMKRSVVMASKGDTEPSVHIDYHQPSLFSGVLNKVISMIGETQIKSKDFLDRFMGESNVGVSDQTPQNKAQLQQLSQKVS
jgi:hypothetical protein